MEAPVINITPQHGFQEKVAACTADIAICGGSAGGGKTWALIFEALRFVDDKDFAAVYFRRTKETIRATGGLLDESRKWCPYFGGELKESVLKWIFPSGAKIDFEGIEYEKDLENWMGTQIPLIIFDELTEFLERMFFFMFSRNRGICTIKPYIRASCNPKPNSWVARFLAWWIDQETGFPIPERDGVLRYMVNYQNRIVWGDSKEEVIKKCPQMFKDERFIESGIAKEDLIKSVTFIRGDVYENKILLKNSPEYLSSLTSMDDADKARYLDGNWKIATDGLGLYQDDMIEKMFNVEPADYDQSIVGYNQSNGEKIITINRDYSHNFISCDAAKFGRDLAVVAVWNKWTIVHTTIFHISDAHDIKSEIELLRVKFFVPRLNVIIDQDGIGGDVIKLGKYVGFVARRETSFDPLTRMKENYKQRKDECYFKSSYKFNEGLIKWILTPSTCKIFDKGATKPRFSTKIKWQGDTTEVSELIKQQLRVIKKGDTTFEGGEKKYATNTKDEQKEMLNGVSPDFADTMMMREDLELQTRRKGKGFSIVE